MDPTFKRDDKLFGLLESIKETFWLDHQARGIPDSQIKQLWGQQYVDRLAPVLSIDAPPRSITKVPSVCYNGLASTNTSASVSQLEFLSRNRTETYKPCSPPLDIIKAGKSRKRASSFVAASSHPDTRSLQIPASFTDSEYGSAFFGRKMQRTASGSRTLPIVSETLVLEDPVEYLEKTGAGCYRPPVGSFPDHILPVHMTLSSHDHTVSTSLHSRSVNQSVPLTPESATVQNESFFSSSMSRQDSLGLDFRNGFAMFRLDSQASNTSDCAAMPPPPPSFLSQLTEQSQSMFESTESDSSLQSSQSQSFASHEFGAASNDAQDSSNSPVKQPHGPIRVGGKSKSQDKTACDTHSASVERLLKPKTRDMSESSGKQVLASILPMEPQRGVLGKYQISKTPYTRPSKEKIKCPLCNRQPDGFRGDHELRRHQKLHHSNTRTGWICVDKSEDGTMLSGCKHCRAEKVYGAYYNAAAHLRRVHFHPRKEGRKARSSASRAGKGGGDDPPMEELKRWMKQVEVKERSKRAAQVPEDGDILSEDYKQPEPVNNFTQVLGGTPISTLHSLSDDLDDFTVDATNFALTSSGCSWPSEESWSSFRNSYAFEESNIFDLELHCEV